jgi:hypothetical protein
MFSNHLCFCDPRIPKPLACIFHLLQIFLLVFIAHPELPVSHNAQFSQSNSSVSAEADSLVYQAKRRAGCKLQSWITNGMIKVRLKTSTKSRWLLWAKHTTMWCVHRVYSVPCHLDVKRHFCCCMNSCKMQCGKNIFQESAYCMTTILS